MYEMLLMLHLNIFNYPTNDLKLQRTFLKYGKVSKFKKRLLNNTDSQLRISNKHT